MAGMQPSYRSKEMHHAIFTRREWRQNGLEFIRRLPALIEPVTQVNHVLLHAVVEPPQPVSDELADKLYSEAVKYAPASLERAVDYLQTLQWNEADQLANNLHAQIGIIALSPLDAHDQFKELKRGRA